MFFKTLLTCVWQYMKSVLCTPYEISHALWGYVPLVQNYCHML
jgi:hypothetical protein